jgi:D-glycero-alpha-D-manno-heptose-7-phosphate kinase
MATPAITYSGFVPEEIERRAAYAQDLIVTRTPLRVSFAGGGTDLPEFYERDYGAVFSSAIDKYVYVTLKRHSHLFSEPIRINYARTEMVERVEDIDNDISRECLKFLNVEPPIYISTVADVPSRTGLGGSSSFTVGLLHALHIYKGERVTPSQLADEASYIEIDVLRQPIGKQDQYATAFGGLNLFRFLPGGQVTVEPQRISKNTLDRLFAYVMLFWTGMTRDAASVLSEQKNNTATKLQDLTVMREHAHRLQQLTSNCRIDAAAIGTILDESWNLKRQMASSITNSAIDRWYNLAMAAGAEGGKICGAGGGGFLLLLVSPDRQDDVRSALHELSEVPVRPDVYGSRVLLPSTH